VAVHTCDFRQSRLPAIETGMRVMGAWRHELRYRAYVDVAVGDDIVLDFAVPAREIWRLRGLCVHDYTALTKGNGWAEQYLRVCHRVSYSPAGMVGEWTCDGIQHVGLPSFSRRWDGSTRLSWHDAADGFLCVRDSDPGVGPMVWPGGAWLRLGSLAAETAGGGAMLYKLQLLVDRLLAADVPAAARAILAARGED